MYIWELERRLSDYYTDYFSDHYSLVTFHASIIEQILLVRVLFEDGVTIVISAFVKSLLQRAFVHIIKVATSVC